MYIYRKVNKKLDISNFLLKNDLEYDIIDQNKEHKKMSFFKKRG